MGVKGELMLLLRRLIPYSSSLSGWLAILNKILAGCVEMCVIL